jgi:hypothetical protein
VSTAYIEVIVRSAVATVFVNITDNVVFVKSAEGLVFVNTVECIVDAEIATVLEYVNIAVFVLPAKNVGQSGLTNSVAEGLKVEGTISNFLLRNI